MRSLPESEVSLVFENPSLSRAMREQQQRSLEQVRRQFLQTCGVGLGSLALGALFQEAASAAVTYNPSEPLKPRAPHFAPKAKQVIYLFMAGGPSQLELFDDKPKLRELHGQKPPASALAGKRFAFLKGNETLLGSSRKFARHGECGMTISELLPNHARIADQLCWLKGLSTDVFNHSPAKLVQNTGFPVPGRPSMGSWATYGLGSIASDLPAFCVMTSTDAADRRALP